jgi:predicted dehydrogenase
MSADRVRLAAIGLGSWGRVLARSARRGDRIDWVTCFARREESRRAFQGDFVVPRAAESLDDVLSDPDVEGVVVTTPNDSHAAIIIRCLEAGIPVFTDKPITDTLAAAAAVARVAKSTGVLLAVGHSARRLGGHRVMKQWLDEGRMGGVSMVECNFSTPTGLTLTEESWRFHDEQGPGGSLIQLGVHHADTLQYLLGPVRAVSGHLRRLQTNAEVSDTTMAVLEFENGALGYLGSGWSSPRIYDMRIQGTECNLSYRLDPKHWAESHVLDGASTLEAQVGDERDLVDVPHSDMFREELDEFADAIRGRGQIETGLEEALRALAVVEAAIISSRQDGRSVEVGPLLNEVSG